MAEGATVVQPPSLGGTDAATRPENGHQVDALRPAWASWMPATAPRAWIAATIGAQASRCSSFQMPVSSGEMRPSADDGGRLGDDEAGAAGRELREVRVVPLLRHAVDRAVLAHRRDPEPVARRSVARMVRGEKSRLIDAAPGRRGVG